MLTLSLSFSLFSTFHCKYQETTALWLHWGTMPLLFVFFCLTESVIFYFYFFLHFFIYFLQMCQMANMLIEIIILKEHLKEMKQMVVQ